MLLISSGPSPPLSGTGEPTILSFFVRSRGTDLDTEMEIAIVLSSLGPGSEKIKQECIIFRTPTAHEKGTQKLLLLKEVDSG